MHIVVANRYLFMLESHLPVDRVACILVETREVKEREHTVTRKKTTRELRDTNASLYAISYHQFHPALLPHATWLYTRVMQRTISPSGSGAHTLGSKGP